MYILNESCNTCTLTLDHTRIFTTSLSSPTFVFPHNCFRYTRSQWLGPKSRTPPLTTCVSPFTSVSHSTQRRHTCITYLGHSLLMQVPTSASQEVVVEGGLGQGRAVIDQCRGVSHRAAHNHISVTRRGAAPHRITWSTGGHNYTLCSKHNCLCSDA